MNHKITDVDNHANHHSHRSANNSPHISLDHLGSLTFKQTYNLRFAYVAGSNHINAIYHNQNKDQRPTTEVSPHAGSGSSACEAAPHEHRTNPKHGDTTDVTVFSVQNRRS